MWPKNHADEVVRLFRHTLETGEPHVAPEHIEQRLDRGVTEYYEWQINRITLPDGRFGVVCYFRDISAHVQARTALEVADRQKDEFLAMLAHELRNPLAPLRNASELLAMIAREEPRTQFGVEVIKRQVTQLTRLVDDLLDVSRITQGRIELTREPLGSWRHRRPGDGDGRTAAARQAPPGVDPRQPRAAVRRRRQRPPGPVRQQHSHQCRQVHRSRWRRSACARTPTARRP